DPALRGPGTGVRGGVGARAGEQRADRAARAAGDGHRREQRAQPGPRRDRRLAEVRRDRGRGAGGPARRAGRGAARNYGEAGAVDRYLPALRPAHSGHNAYWDLGPPPADATAVIVVGYRAEQLRAWFGRVEQAAVVDNGVGLDNDEQGVPVWVARD